MDVKFYKEVFLKHFGKLSEGNTEQLSTEQILKRYQPPKEECDKIYELINSLFGINEEATKVVVENMVKYRIQLEKYGTDEFYNNLLNSDYEFFKINRVLEEFEADQIEKIEFKIVLDKGPCQNKETISIKSEAIIHKILEVLYDLYPGEADSKRKKGRTKMLIKTGLMLYCRVQTVEHLKNLGLTSQFKNSDKFFLVGLIATLSGLLPTFTQYSNQEGTGGYEDYRKLLIDRVKHYQ